MITFKSLLLLGLIYIAYSTNASDSLKVTCPELGLYFMLPAVFNSLDSSQINALSKRGEKAINETFHNESLQGWQPVCFNLQDSFKRTVLLTAITVKEVIAQDGNTDKFIDHTFKDGNDFIIQRLKSRRIFMLTKRNR